MNFPYFNGRVTPFIFMAILCVFSFRLSAQPLRVATWNAEHLVSPVSDGCKPRSKEQLIAMQGYARNLNADVVALQEVASAEAVHLLFPEAQWNVVMSSRPDSEPYTCRESGRTSTQQKVAFAIKKSIQIVSTKSITELGLEMPGLRYGLEATLSTAVGNITLLNVHMKSGCFVDNYSRAETPACETFGKQAPILDSWVEQKEQSGETFMVLGDFNHRLTAPYNHLTQALMRDDNGQRNSLQNTGPELISCHPYYPAPIDNIFVGNMPASNWHYNTQIMPFSDMRVDAMLSDHCAVLTEVQHAVSVN